MAQQIVREHLAAAPLQLPATRATLFFVAYLDPQLPPDTSQTFRVNDQQVTASLLAGIYDDDTPGLSDGPRSYPGLRSTLIPAQDWQTLREKAQRHRGHVLVPVARVSAGILRARFAKLNAFGMACRKAPTTKILQRLNEMPAQAQASCLRFPPVLGKIFVSVEGCMEPIDCLVIGAGVIGLAIARALSGSGREVLVIEQGPTFGAETSSRNSEVIHAGIYYAPESLMATLCIAGRKALYAYCESRNIAYQRYGKLIVATAAEEVHRLDHIAQHARGNGVDDLVFLTKAEALALEPALSCEGVLLSPSAICWRSWPTLKPMEPSLLTDLGFCVRCRKKGTLTFISKLMMGKHQRSAAMS